MISDPDFKVVEFYLYPTVGTILIHSVKPELTEYRTLSIVSCSVVLTIVAFTEEYKDKFCCTKIGAKRLLGVFPLVGACRV